MGKKIVYIVGDLSYPNGMSRVLSQKVNYLAEHADYQLFVVLTEQASKPWFYQLSPKVQVVNFDLNFDELYKIPLLRRCWLFYKRSMRYKRLLTDYLMQVRPDITVSILRREINFINDINDGSKKVGEIHFNRDSYRTFHKSWLPACVNRFVTRWWKRSLDRQIRRLDHFVVLTHQDYAMWQGFSNISIIPNPIVHFPPGHSTCDHHRAIAIGRYTYQKGFDMLIDAWNIVHQRYPDWILNIYGAGERESYQKQVRALGLEESILCHASVSDVYEHYLESSIFVFSSRYEGFGLVLAEAMSCGVPPVSFRCPCGPEDIITDGVDGLLVEPENVEKLAEAVIYLIEHEAVRKQMSVQGVISARRYQESHIMKQWIEVFNKLTEKQ